MVGLLALLSVQKPPGRLVTCTRRQGKLLEGGGGWKGGGGMEGGRGGLLMGWMDQLL